MIELVSGMPAPRFGEHVREYEGQSWFKIQGVSAFGYHDVRCFGLLQLNTTDIENGQTERID
jgi:hypothetical protein